MVVRGGAPKGMNLQGMTMVRERNVAAGNAPADVFISNLPSRLSESRCYS